MKYAANNNNLSKKYVWLVAIIVSTVVALFTVYSLILPAATLETTDDINLQGTTVNQVAEKTLQAEEMQLATTQSTTVSTESQNSTLEVATVAAEAKDVNIDPKIGGNLAVPEGYTDLDEYIKKNNEKDECSYIGYDLSDPDGNIVTDIYSASGDGYIFTLYIYTESGILPGNYYYLLPDGISSATIKSDGVIKSNDSDSIGTYTVSDDMNFILFNFSDKANEYQEVSGEIGLNLNFDEIATPSISKTGEFSVTDGTFNFEIKAIIPAYRRGGACREWYIRDESTVGSTWQQNLDDATFSITYESIGDMPVHKLDEAIANDEQIAYITTKKNDKYYTYLVIKCDCDETCHHYSEEERRCTCLKDVASEYADYTGWCVCWTLPENAVLTVKYSNNINGNDGSDLLTNKKTIGDEYVNRAYLNDISSITGVKIPDFIDKTGSVGSDYKGTFSININNDYYDMANVDSDKDGNFDTSIIAFDRLDYLSYIPGSAVITAYNSDGDEYQLKYGEDYKITYVADGQYTGSMTFEIFYLGPYKYNIKYNTMLLSNKAEGVMNTVHYSNSASINIFGKDFDDPNNPTDSYGGAMTFKNRWNYVKYAFTLIKTEENDSTIESVEWGKRVPNAVYGLYSKDGYLMNKMTTDENGSCVFSTNVSRGIIFTPKTIYYIQEIETPKGYSLDTSKHWFYFNNGVDEEFENNLKLELANENIEINCLDISLAETDSIIHVTDELGAVLPETGGTGQQLVIIGVVLIMMALICVVIRRKIYKNEV